jgi:Skp family chaperone for outer membrane proteins
MKLKTLLTILCTIILSTGISFADSIGTVDMEKIFIESKMVKTFEKNITKKREDYKAIFEKKQEKLEKARSKGKSDKEIEEMISEIEEELRPKQEEIAQLEGGFQQTLLFTIQATAKDVAKEYGIDVVMDKRAIFHGGFDLTGFIIQKLNDE